MPRPELGQWDSLSIDERLEALRRAVAQKLITHVKFVRVHGFADRPSQSYAGDAGFDLSIVEDVLLQPGEKRDVPTGVIAAIPDGYWGHIIARSGVVRKFPIEVQEAVIDCGFRGELKVLVKNVGVEEISFKVGDRLAQIIVVPLPPRLEWVEQASLPEAERDQRGFGSSGLGQTRLNL